MVQQEMMDSHELRVVQGTPIIGQTRAFGYWHRVVWSVWAKIN